MLPTSLQKVHATGIVHMETDVNYQVQVRRSTAGLSLSIIEMIGGTCLSSRAGISAHSCNHIYYTTIWPLQAMVTGFNKQKSNSTSGKKNPSTWDKSRGRSPQRGCRTTVLPCLSIRLRTFKSTYVLKTTSLHWLTFSQLYFPPNVNLCSVRTDGIYYSNN